MCPKLHVTDSGMVVSAMYVASSRSIAIAEMNLMPSSLYDLGRLGKSLWWICRVVVDPKYRRQGYGRRLVETLAKHRRKFAMIVAPGGYDTPPKEQEAFYASCRFVRQGEFMVRKRAEEIVTDRRS